jgi:hypothetical protein
MSHFFERVSRFRAGVVAFLDRVDARLCAGQDERARGHGWTVVRTGFGARRYRDPRFDMPAARARLATSGADRRVWP